MAETIALQALGWVASPVIKILIEKTVTYLGTDLAKELEDLETTIFPQFELVINAAQTSPHKQIVAKWLRRLKKAYYDIEDIIDDLEYQHIENEVKNGKKEKGSSSNSFFKPVTNLTNKIDKKISLLSQKISLLSPTQKKLWNKLQKLKKYADESKNLYRLLKMQPVNNVNHTTNSVRGPMTTASFPVNKVIGRDKDRDSIIDLLVNESVGESNHTIAITGIGGAGKTTLAQYIFRDQTIKKHFDKRIWVCLSPELDVIKHTKEMIQSASRTCLQLDSLDALQRELDDILDDSKSTLLMLDDVCYNGQVEEETWYQLLAPFSSHVGKYKILLTSRSNSLPNALDPINHIKLRDLHASDFKSLFRYFAFSGTNSQQIKELEEIGDKIAEKLSGSPLAAKAVASRLSRKLDYREWKNTLDNVNLSNVSDSLLWTYQRLDAQIQRCFLYCSIFPKGVVFNEIELLNLWLCENFIKCSEETYDIKEKAKEYFNELIACSFFLPLGADQSSNYEYEIHDLFHDLAEKLSKEDCFRIEGSSIPKEIPSTVRYICISVSDLKEEHISIISKLDGVRTVHFGKPFVNDVFKQLLSKLKKLRVLVLRFYNHVQLPELVGELKHLRYLDTVQSSISEYPDSLCKLYHLQVLLLSAYLKKLPGKLSNLKMLRHIEMLDNNEKPVGTIPPIANIGNITSLETLRQFYVRKENGFELRQLGNLKRLKGVLRIENMENCTRVDAIEAKLSDKKDLERLELIWGNCGKRDDDFDLEMIEGLQPHENLKQLLIENYGAARYPSWLLGNSGIRNLHSLALQNCFYLQVLPSNLTYCDELILSSLYELRDLSHLPERLTSLTIKFCPALAFAPKEKTQFNNQYSRLNEAEFLTYWLPFYHRVVGRIFFKNEITMLRHIPMPKKKDFYEYLQTYKNAVEVDQPLDEHTIQAWWYCHQQRMDFVYKESVNAPKFILSSTLTTLDLKYCNITDGALSDCLRGLISLNKLHLEAIMSLTTLPSEHVMRQLKSLKRLTIKGCWCLRSLGFLQGLVSLEELEIGSCPCLDIKHTRDCTTFPTSLESLILWECVIPDGIFTNCDMQYLNTFRIERCRGPEFLSIGMLTSLRDLVLWNYPDLCKVEGLQSLPDLQDLLLIDLPNFQAGSLLETPMDLRLKELEISSLEMLKALSANNAFASLKILFIKKCQEETFTLEGLACIPSLHQLSFVECKIKVLPNSLKALSPLLFIDFDKCPEISSVPELPESIREIRIEKCPVLKERCRAPDGPDWPKIAHIPYKYITD